MTKKLIFIYNAESGVGNAISDSIHKFISPETYPCNLCALTHGYFGEKKAWSKFINSLTLPIEFYHKNELPVLPYTLPLLPCILLVDENTIHWSISGDDRQKVTSLDNLIETVTDKLSLYGTKQFS